MPRNSLDLAVPIAERIRKEKAKQLHLTSLIVTVMKGYIYQ